MGWREFVSRAYAVLWGELSEKSAEGCCSEVDELRRVGKLSMVGENGIG